MQSTAMDQIIPELAQDLLAKLSRIDSRKRLLVGICGVPASGKSTIAFRLVNHLNENFRASLGIASQPHTISSEIVICVGLDGWHFTRATLDTFQDPTEAHARRGAAFTFDADEYVRFVTKLRATELEHIRNANTNMDEFQESTSTSRQEVSDANGVDPGAAINVPTIYAPSFAHELKDPTPDAIAILPNHRIVIIEGLYTMLGIHPWNKAAELLDERWFVEVDVMEARTRIIKRHVLTGITKDEEEAARRADLNDTPNGQFVIQHMLPPTRTIVNANVPQLGTSIESQQII
jgi:pantothenate kinase